MDEMEMIPLCRQNKLTDEAAKQIHGNWRRFIPVLDGKAKMFYESGRQCFCCEWYVPFEWPLGADWGGCTNYDSEWNGRVVFEHHTCVLHKYIK